VARGKSRGDDGAGLAAPGWVGEQSGGGGGGEFPVEKFGFGGEFGFGAEIGISTDKLHARGPMGLRELTSYQYRVRGNGQVRG